MLRSSSLFHHAAHRDNITIVPSLQARNVIERLPKPLHASIRKALRQAWELEDADKAERLLRNLARRIEHEAPSAAASIIEGLDEILTVNRLGLPAKLKRSLACTNAIENMMGTVRHVCRNVKRWRNAAMALRWMAAGMLEAAKGFWSVVCFMAFSDAQ
jgi:transposase-like protein